MNEDANWIDYKTADQQHDMTVKICAPEGFVGPPYITMFKAGIGEIRFYHAEAYHLQVVKDN